MIDAIANAFQFDAFLLALVGQLATEASAKVTFAAVKVAAYAAVGVMFRPDVEVPRRRARKKGRVTVRRGKKARRSLYPEKGRIKGR
jgi:hypothetical protein